MNPADRIQKIQEAMRARRGLIDVIDVRDFRHPAIHLKKLNSQRVPEVFGSFPLQMQLQFFMRQWNRNFRMTSG